MILSKIIIDEWIPLWTDLMHRREKKRRREMKRERQNANEITLHNCWPGDSSSNGCREKHFEQANKTTCELIFWSIEFLQRFSVGSWLNIFFFIIFYCCFGIGVVFGNLVLNTFISSDAWHLSLMSFWTNLLHFARKMIFHLLWIYCYLQMNQPFIHQKTCCFFILNFFSNFLLNNRPVVSQVVCRFYLIL